MRHQFSLQFHGVKRLRLRFPPALALFLLSPAIGELLSGSAPPAEFFTPFGFLMIVCLYGSGAVIIRELTVRWKKGVGSTLLLGAAYGVLEEGLLVTSWFSPFWVDLGPMAVYGRWLGVNWVWAEMLTIYHAVFSITIPILLVDLACPQRRDESWVGKKVFGALLIVLTAVTVFGVFLFSTMMNYWTPLPQYLFGIAIMLVFVYLARRLPADWGMHGQKALPKTIVLWIVAAVAGFAFFLGFYSSPYLVPWPVAMLYGPLLIFLMFIFLKRFNWGEKASDMHVFALCSGALTFFLVFAPLQELDKSRKDVTAGMSLVALAFAIGLIWLGLKIKQRNKDTPDKWTTV
ncbi:MAG TPA: hypothetical protein VJ249_07420 [Candidatus Bathyarchaeia archaeon]|nr:hypothetical protein [Candidatus Bathyarchaeia archaeon]